jgi:glycosyltransferase involved in cell wall biosynthesis
MIYWGWLGSHPATVLLKYLGQSLSTLRTLARERPDVVFVMSPPPVAIVPVYAYCRFARARFVVDAHTGVFLTKRWRYFQAFQYFFCRRASATIVSNDHLADLLRAQGAHPVVVPHVPIEYDEGGRPPAGMDAFTVVCVTSFDRDEPIAAMVTAAGMLPDVQFWMTGDIASARRALPKSLPGNLRLTGFLSAKDYGALIRRAGVVVALTTDDHTMQRAAYEAIYHGTPVIVSDTALLRRAFDQGALHVDNTPMSLAAAVRTMRADPQTFRRAAAALRERKNEQWTKAKGTLLAALESR